MSRISAAVLIAAATGCRPGASSPPITNAADPAGSLAALLVEARAKHGDVLLVSAGDGIKAYTPDLAPIATLTKTPGRYLHPDPTHSALYFFVDRRLVRLDLASGTERTVSTLPELRHSCFGSEDGAVNPLDFIQRHEDIVVDVARGFACLNVLDRNMNMMSVAIAYRVALDTGAVIQKTTFTLDNCRDAGEVESAEGPCTAGDQAGPDLVSPSKKWELVRDPDLGDMGDYIYSATFVTEKATKATYAIRADGIDKIDYAAAQAAGKAPEGTCLLPFETLVRWFPHTDIALITGCTDAGALLVRPPATVGKVAGNDFAFY